MEIHGIKKDPQWPASNEFDLFCETKKLDNNFSQVYIYIYPITTKSLISVASRWTIAPIWLPNPPPTIFMAIAATDAENSKSNPGRHRHWHDEQIEFC